MKLLNVKSARSIWLLDIQDLNPKGKNFIPEVTTWIKETYNFQVAPDIEKFISAGLQGENAQQQLRFKSGRFLAPSELLIGALPYIEVNLEIYRDGIVAETFSSTQDSDSFIQELLNSACEHFDLVFEPSMIREKLYASEVHIKSDVLLDALDPRLGMFAEKLSRMIPRRGAFRTASLGFWTDPGTAGGHLTFALECQAGKPFAQQRFFSTAPIGTQDHLTLLEELEHILSL